MFQKDEEMGPALGHREAHESILKEAGIASPYDQASAVKAQDTAEDSEAAKGSLSQPFLVEEDPFWKAGDKSNGGKKRDPI